MRNVVTINDIQFDFMLGDGIIDLVFILRKIQEEYLANQTKVACAS